MLIRDIMKSPVVAIPPGTSLEDAYRTMQEKRSGTSRSWRRTASPAS